MLRGCAVRTPVRQSSRFRRTARARTTRAGVAQTGCVESWEFGRAVRRWRDRARPRDGRACRPGGRRRATGLRREELAGLAGISADYLTRLEQGRATSPSAQVVEALARALRLSDAERELLFRLAGQAAPGLRCRLVAHHAERAAAARPARAHAGRRVRRRVEADRGQRALRRADGRDLGAGAGSSATASGATSSAPAPAAVHTPEEQAELEARLVADLRLTAPAIPPTAQLQAAVGELRAAEPALRRAVGVAPSPPQRDQSRHKIIDHPAVGRIALDCDTLIVAGTTCGSWSTPPNPAPRTPNASHWRSSSARRRSWSDLARRGPEVAAFRRPRGPRRVTTS